MKREQYNHMKNQLISVGEKVFAAQDPVLRYRYLSAAHLLTMRLRSDQYQSLDDEDFDLFDAEGNTL